MYLLSSAYASEQGRGRLLIGFIWIIQAFAERAFNELWWLGRVSGILMITFASAAIDRH